MSGAAAPLSRAELERVANPFALLVTRYARNRPAFVREILGAEPDGWQLDALKALDAGHCRISIRSGHGVGKTTFLAWVMLHWLLTRYPCKCVATAPSSSQLFDALWPELRTWMGKLPPAWQDLLDPTSDRIRLKAAPEEVFISARTSRAEQPDALQGVHSRWVLLIADEAAGISEAVFEAAGGSMSTPGAVTIMTGNPTRNSGTFWRSHNLERERWWTRRVSCIDSPRVDREFIREIAERYGIDSNAYRIRVLGEFPLSDGDTLIAAQLVEDAMARMPDIDLGQPEIWGVDVARFGSDRSVLIKRRGLVVLEPPRRWAGVDTMTLTGAIFAEYQACNDPPSMVLVDSIGVGAGVADRLRELKVPAVDVNVAEAAPTTERFVRLRDEIWQKMADWLQGRNVSLPYDEGLRDALVGPRYTFMSDGKFKLETKDEMRRRGVRSPDEADALAHTFAPAAITVSTIGRMGWNEPLRRNLRGLV